MPEYRYTVRIVLEGPMISRALGTRSLGLDTTALRDADGRPALPGSLVRGNLRHAWDVFADIGALTRERMKAWLGAGPDDIGPGKGTGAQLRFADRWCTKNIPEENVHRHRIKIDPETGAAESGAWQLIEIPYPTRTKVTFEGYVDAQIREDERDLLRRWLAKGLAYAPGYGGLKGVGFGRTLKVHVEEARSIQREIREVRATARPWTAARPVGTALGLRLTLDRPFCFPRAYGRDNRFVSEDFIPGSAVKGAMAGRLKVHYRRKDDLPFPCEGGPWPTLARYFDNLRITHALPVIRGRGQRPVAVPYSLVFGPALKEGGWQRDDLYDIAIRGGPGLIHDRAPVFSPDWTPRQWQRARDYAGWEHLPERRLTVRNRIDPKTGAVHWDEGTQTGSLFTIEAVIPDKHSWLANLHLGGIPEDQRQQAFAELLDLFADGLPELGKTKARATVEVRPDAYPFTHPTRPISSNPAVVSLQSSALLLPWDFDAGPTNDGDTLFKAYADSWQWLSNSTLRLVTFFARQALAGGEYWWRRFRESRQPYRPVMLTLPGSVFVLEVLERSGAEQALRTWLDSGVPPARMYSRHWQQNPWIPQNGYGEIAVNLDLHWRRMAPEGAWNDP